MQFLGSVKGVTAAPNGNTLFSGVSLRARRRRGTKTDDDSSSHTNSNSGMRTGISLSLKRSSSSSASADSSTDFSNPTPEMRPRTATRTTAAAVLKQNLDPPLYRSLHLHDVALRGSMPLDTVSKSSPPHVAVRYGDTIRLFARSKYAESSGGYVGTFEGGKRFLSSKNPQKQDELACVPPIAASGAKQYKPSTFVILSNCGLGVGTPVSYGDVVVLEDADGRVWNNKMGVGPSTKNGFFGPKESNTPGEMYLSFYQLQADNSDDSSSESSDDEDNILFFSNLARTTKTMAETTFGKPTQAELHLATAALRTMGKVMYYGDRNIIIDVADSNRVRSKFNRVITHYSKQQESAAVQGGYLRCDGRGKTILFEMHGQELPTIQSIDISDSHNLKMLDESSSAVDTDKQNSGETVDHDASVHVTLSTMKDVAVGQPITLLDMRRSTTLVVHFSDGGRIPKAFLVAENGNVAKATERYGITTAWRKEVMVDSILAMPQTHYDTIKAHYTQFLHKHDKLGHPIFVEKIGSINIPQLKKAGIDQDALFRHYLFTMEFTLKYAAHQICPCDACASSDTQKMCIILDARGIGMRDMGGEGFEFIRRCTSVMQRHYPQRSFKIFIVNVPSWFGMAWKGVKPLLNEATRAKTNILTESETAGSLLEFIDAENLPVEYGGTCACTGGCDSHSSYQLLQRALVKSVLECKPFESEELMKTISSERSGESRSSCEEYVNNDATPSSSPPPSVMGPIKRETSATAVLDQLFRLGSRDDKGDSVALDEDDDGFCRSIPPGLFIEEVLKAGYLLKRSLRHKQFNPIWHRQLFILHPQFLRFAKTLDSEIFQIVSLTHDTVVQKTTKQNNSFEIVTPLMAANGHSLLLYAPTSFVLNNWVDAISGAIDQLKRKAPTPAASPERSPIVSPKAANRESDTQRTSFVSAPET
ncbi:hypothetical protein BBO99_00005536 [Phytophthora kernoviae]|uniref:CRAL-TRIO domain-containing protein n=1 Tax=Phytophthora kernoviae TaxID=325452 RepID=A0A3R7HHT0_9STRA|nr:hypothetical protein JM16_004413 [Phytophthora kernoviae]RLN13786.1 hypothetical protein BBI17_005162 [Phytophthora kernoviae]RLN79063.1 hypothetical protein BBO99_00005536 [Phytophthora kernoviae]